MKRRITVISVVGLCALAAVTLTDGGRWTTADDESPATAQDRWMAAKLSSAQHALEHLTRGEFDKLQATARRMQVMNFLEQWRREEDFEEKSDYQGQLNAFEFATKELIRHAGDENTDGALEAYVAMTETCVRCHTLIRDVE